MISSYITALSPSRLATLSYATSKLPPERPPGRGRQKSQPGQPAETRVHPAMRVASSSPAGQEGTVARPRLYPPGAEPTFAPALSPTKKLRAPEESAEFRQEYGSAAS